MDLERELRRLEVDWPETPSFRLAYGRRRRLLVPVALVLAAVAIAFAVPQSRGAILGFFAVGGERVQVVAALPRAVERPLAAGLGPVVAPAVARPTLVPPLTPLPPLHRSGPVLSLLFRYRGREVLLSELRAGGPILKKLASGATRIEAVRVRGVPGLWLGGAQHVVVFPRAPARLAGGTLVWATADVTYRLESEGLSRDAAVALARLLREYPGRG